MQTLIELAPLIAFFAAYKFAGIYVATAVLMGRCCCCSAGTGSPSARFRRCTCISAVLVWVFGTATLILHDVRFIQWKATIFYWLVALVLGGSIWIGKKTLLERLMTAAVPEGAHRAGFNLEKHLVAGGAVLPGAWRRESLGRHTP